MIILPAIDIKDGECVRLFQGDFSTTEKVSDNYLDTAQKFEKDGAEWVHMVDLDGAVSGEMKNNYIFIQVANKTNLKVELGGGIRNLKAISYYIENGIDRVILGSAAINDPKLVEEAVKEYGEKIAVGIDAKDGFVKTSGWLKESKVNYIDIAKRMEDIGVKTIIFTDISRDGTLRGPNIEQLITLNESVSSNIIASGGIRDIDDIKKLLDMNLYGAICGKAIYKNTLSLKEAIELVKRKV
ncbi:MAG: 1-(5-phosphoribosyl)-5-[(5-phosphoribosylamino)methylideneamino]imidazole-4-carboxamide isomerase [Clostridiales bacterium]|nr:1-(5-phosphoribosyl)-5-[(5-phosphoribosylamino)methylideneamino]imidazole-4-carboxamide isomerase [Clostridiales bacterium]